MENTFLTSVDIQKVRHLHDISIPLSDKERNHLILTGKNGSGKTSVLDALISFLAYAVRDEFSQRYRERIKYYNAELGNRACASFSTFSILMPKKALYQYAPESTGITWKEKTRNSDYPCNKLNPQKSRVTGSCTSLATLRKKYQDGHFILAYYKAGRRSKVAASIAAENELKSQYAFDETPGAKLVKYMVGMKSIQALALRKGDAGRAAEIDTWFTWFENILKRIFDDSTLKLEFDDEKLQFHILQSNREPFDFNTMSSGYSAIFAIINDLVMRMEHAKDYSTEGIVLVDEIEAHLHLQLQKEILPLLTELFPNIQFIVTSYSPFILNSIQNAVIYDLETQKLVADGLANYPYDGIVEGYFQADILSDSLREKLKRYAALVKKPNLSDEDYAEIMELEQDLDEIPDFLSPEIASRYSQLKLELSNKG